MARITSKDIIMEVCEIMYATPEEIMSRNKIRRIAAARQVAMHSLRVAGYTFPKIARIFGLDHTTVIHATNAVERDKNLAAVVDMVARNLGVENKSHKFHRMGDGTGGYYNKHTCYPYLDDADYVLRFMDAINKMSRKRFCSTLASRRTGMTTSNVIIAARSAIRHGFNIDIVKSRDGEMYIKRPEWCK